MQYNVRMRAEKGGRHISGAERIVTSAGVQEALRGLTDRAMTHPNGEPDSLSLTVNALEGEVTRIAALPVVEMETRTPLEARRVFERELTRLGIDAAPVLDLFYSLHGMRGAVLLQQHTLMRLEPDTARGLRASCLDYEGNPGGAKNHLQEALCLASKVTAHPLIVAELCMSDDPDYTTGYFASRERGYMRLRGIKEKGDPRGGRIFLFSGSAGDVQACATYLETSPVLVVMP
jgi:6-carboxyhexanoate--CoA ligase